MVARTRLRTGFDGRRVPPPELGPILRAARKRAGLSVRLLAYASGVSRTHLSSLENGLRCPSASVAESLAEVLRLDTDELSALRAAAVPDAGRDSPLRHAA